MYFLFKGGESMKLILSSCDFQNDNSKKLILENLDREISECKVLYIPNEKATSEKIRVDTTVTA